MRRIERAGLRAPARVLDIGLPRADGSSDVLDVTGIHSLWCLTREHGVPTGISFWDVSDDRTVRLSDIVDAEMRDAGGTHGTAASAGVGDPPGIGLTVAICTRDRPDGLRRALASLRDQTDRGFSLVVAENAPSSDAGADVVAGARLPRCSYVIEPRPGLSHTRNTALSRVGTEYVAWMDDDEVMDPRWIEQIKAGFAHPSRPAAVCGVMLPAELETQAQVHFEQYGGFNKGRTLAPEVLVAGSPLVPSPLYPLPAIGSGGNMAFRTASLRDAGGFDPCLGAGTRTHGGEETRVFAVLLRSGHTVLHWPSAIAWHYHRRDDEALRRQFYGYGAGLSAFYASMIRSDPRVVIELLGLVPQMLRDLGLGSGGRRTEEVPADFPPSLLRASRNGLLTGAWLYVREAVSQRAGRTTR
jgi:glycosyltransferase involved in cell wall biosynthesis